MKLHELITEKESSEADLIILRGLPGSGKSTYVKKNFSKHKHYEADMFHMKNGKYDWKQENQAAAHKWCLDSTKKSLENGYKVVVSNTFTTKKEINRYTDMADKLGKKVKVFRTTKHYGSIHNVPEETLERMKKRMVDIPGEVKI